MAEAGDTADLIRRAREGEREAFAGLYRRTARPLYRYCAAQLSNVPDAEEVTQEVFMAALGGIGNLRASDETGLLAWLYQIARHKVADRLRRRYRRPTAPLEAAEALESADPPPLEQAIGKVDQAAVREALAKLTADQRDVVICKYVLEYDNARTAAIVGKNSNAVNQLHHRALASLKRLLQEEMELT